MITFETLKKYAEKTGKDYETRTTICHSRFPRFEDPYYMMDDNDSHKEYSETWFGIELKPNVYYWWTSNGASEQMLFQQRYNRNTGGIIKGWKTGFSAEMLIEKKLK